MKILKYTYLPIICATLLFFGTTAQAVTTTFKSLTYSVTNGSDITAKVENYAGLDGVVAEVEQVSGTYQAWWEYNPTYTVWLNGVGQQFLTGYLIMTVQITPSAGTTRFNSYDVTVENDEGLHVSVIQIDKEAKFRVFVVFDNYSFSGNNKSVCQITVHYTDTETAYSATAADTFTTTFTNSGSNITKYSTVQNDRLTALIYSAITQGAGPQLANIIDLLTAIKNQDLTYYVSIVNSLATLHTDNQTLHGDLAAILNEIDLDFQSVQTVLDLFPSYRTAVLNYWAEFMQMNAAQSSAVAELGNDYANKESQSSQILSGYNSITMPSLAAGDLDIMASTNTTQRNNFFGLIALITHNGLITTIMLTIITAAIAGFILYGKKG